MTITAESYSELKKSNPAIYKLLNNLLNSSSYATTDMNTGCWFIKNNPYFVTDAQWATIAVRMLSYENLKDKTLTEVIESFYYESQTLKVKAYDSGEYITYQIPSGNIMGWMQGMFMCIGADGTINT